MRERNGGPDKKRAPVVLEKKFSEIVVGSGRSQEPYIIAFHLRSDNVAGESLGTLFGFFEVEVHDQDAAYIVNFLASVAKKEYFTNPRRGSVESFEVALHKVNVALSEIVKHGNVSWLGHLHGIIGAVSRNTVHFSATGEGALYLSRGDSFRLISDGLADEGSEPHPLKTFTEISSGELFDGDVMLVLSPAIWSLFSPEDLRKNLFRLGPAGFEQFLRTALVNELPIAAALIVTCSAPVVESRREEKEVREEKSPTRLTNVFSGKPFAEALRTRSKKPEEKTDTEEETPPEYTDSKTGHIYVQGDAPSAGAPDESRWRDTWHVFSERLEFELHTKRQSLRRATRRLSRESILALSFLGSKAKITGRSLNRRLRVVTRKWKERKPEPAQDEAPVITPPHTPPSDNLPRESRLKRWASRSQEVHVPVTESEGQAPHSQEEKRFGEMLVTTKARLANLFTSLSVILKRGLDAMMAFWSARSLPIRVGIGIALIAVLFLIAFFLLRDQNPETADAPLPTATVAATPSVFPPADEPLARHLTEKKDLFALEGANPLTLGLINSAPYLATSRSIVDIATKESIASPEPLRLATMMDDLDALFALSESGKLYLYSVSTKKFAENSLPLPSGASIDALGAYLTYLYVLDIKGDKIYRFPRAEGGFGTPTTWNRASLGAKEDTPFAVFESIALLRNDNAIATYERGTKTGVTFQGPHAAVSPASLSFGAPSGALLALDREQNRIVRWSPSGTLENQYYAEVFNEVRLMLLSSDANELYTADSKNLAAWSLR